MRVKEEKGSVAVVVIVAILFIVALSTTMYFSAVNRKNIGDKATETIKQAYEKDVNNMDDLYATYIEEGLYIYTKEDLEKFRDRVNSGVDFTGKTIYLMNNINLNVGKYTENEDGIVTFSEDAEQWTPIGSQNKPFEGNFDGMGNKISGIYIDSIMNYQGVFGYCKGDIQKLNIEDTSIKGSSYIGGIVGYTEGEINNCTSDSEISFTSNYVGGIAGYSKGEILNCKNTGNINYVPGSTIVISNTGGIVGCYRGEIIQDCYNIGIINTGKERTAGIAGESYGKISRCKNEGEVIGASFTAGIVGIAYADIEECVNKGYIHTTSGNTSAGIVAKSNGTLGINITSCYNTGTVEISNLYNGGILGAGIANIANCYNVGIIQSGHQGAQIRVWLAQGDVTDSYYQTELGLSANGAIARSKYEMLQDNFVIELNENSDQELYKKDSNNINNGYPILNWE